MRMRPLPPLPWRFAVAGAFLATFKMVAVAEAAAPAPSDAPDLGEAANDPTKAQAATALDPGDLSEDAGAEAKGSLYAVVEEEASAHERAGRFVEALAAWERLADSGEALTPAQRAEREGATTRLAALARGRAVDDPASTQREVLDFRRAGAERSTPAPLDTRTPTSEGKPNRVVDQWYFWVAVSLIAASVGTIAGLAIQSATNPGGVDGRAGVAAQPAAPSAALVRF